MRRSRIFALTSAFAVCAAAVLSYDRLADSPAERMSAAAQQLLSALDESQQKTVRLPYDSPKRVEWNFVPLDTRKGLPLKEMSEEQRELSRSLLATALSEVGYKKADQIQNLERLLEVLEGPDRRWSRDWLLYYVTIYGDPAGQERWGLSFEGHHLSLNFVVDRGQVVASTPQFMGANPATVMTAGAGVEKGTRVLGAEERLGFALLSSLDGMKREKAIISAEPPREVRGAGEPQPPTVKPEGLAAAEMDETQKKTLKELVATYADAMPEPVSNARKAAIQKAGFDKIRFAWLGAEKPGIGHGYRVQGPTFLIEFVNTQPDAEGNPANHIHAVWRDMNGDFAIPLDR